MNDVKDIYNENYKLLKNEIKEDIRKQKDIPRSWIRKSKL
jgi:hypothetical protein